MVTTIIHKKKHLIIKSELTFTNGAPKISAMAVNGRPT